MKTWKKWLIGLVIFGVIVEVNDFFCGDKPSKKENKTQAEESEPAEVPKVHPLDTSLSYSTYVSDYVPALINGQEELLSYVKDYAEFCDDYYASLDDKLETMSKLAGIKTSADERSKDAIDGGKKLVDAWGSLRSGLGTIASTVWDAKDVVRLESKRKELKKKYASGVLDTLWIVEQYLNNYAYYSYVGFLVDQSEKIDEFTSVWTQPSSFTADYFEELGFDRSRDLLMAVRQDVARVRKLLIYNQMKGIESNYVEDEVEKLQSFWSDEELEFESDARLFKPIWYSLTRLKTDLIEKQSVLDDKRVIWNEDALKEMTTQLGRIEDLVEADIEALNIYELPDTEWSFFTED